MNAWLTGIFEAQAEEFSECSIFAGIFFKFVNEIPIRRTIMIF